MRIVIVEDHPMILQVLTAALSTVPGYQVQGHATAASGVEACLAGADLAIFDHRLPDMTGTEAVNRLRAEDATRHLPIIMVTGDGDARTRMESIKAGATDFLPKPVNIDELRLRVRNLLALHAAQTEAERREHLLDSVIAASQAALAVADARDPATPLIYASDALSGLLAQDKARMLADRHPLAWIDAPASAERDELAAALAERAAGRFVLQALRAGAGPFWAEVTLHPVPAPGAAAHHLVIALRDISDLVDMRAAHDRLSARMSDIARISGAWFFEIDARGRLAYVSESMVVALGGRRGRGLVGLPVDRLPIRLADPVAGERRPSALLAPPHAAAENRLLEITLPDGSTRAVQVSLVPFHDAAGRFGGFRGHAHDVSDITRARDLADRASRAKSAFLATMSHEFRTPLTAIVGMADTLAQASADPGRTAALSTIREQADHLASVLGDVLDFATMERGDLVLADAPFDPVAVLHEAADSLCEAARAAGLDAVIAVQGDPTALRRGDAPRLRQILRQLVSNAVKFTVAGGITVTLDLTDPHHLRVEIADTGIGMTSEELARVFDPFVQADDGTARRFGGSGLGLSIAQALARAMGGAIVLVSEPGKGTQARLELQLPVARSAAPGRVDLTGARVLVADDNRANRKILETMLVRLGAGVVLCADGQEALDTWRGDKAFNLLLLDINMPHLAGTDVARRVRDDPDGQAVPLLAVTANALPDQVADYVAAGFDACLGKPFTAAGLAQALQPFIQDGGVQRPAVSTYAMESTGR